MAKYCDTSELWERVGYLSACTLKPSAATPLLEAVRVVLRAIDDDATGDIVALHERLTEVLLSGVVSDDQ